LLTLKDQETFKTPVSSDPIASNAPVERSIDVAESQLGHSSMTVAVVEAPVSVGRDRQRRVDAKRKARKKRTSVRDSDRFATVASRSIHRSLKGDHLVRIRRDGSASSSNRVFCFRGAVSSMRRKRGDKRMSSR